MDDEKTMTEKAVTEEKSKWDQIGEMPLKDAVKFCWKYILDMKLETVGICAFSLILLTGMGFLLYYGLVPVCKLIWHCISMTIGMHEYAYQYTLFDSDLLCTVPLAILIASLVGYCSRKHRLLNTICYFILLQATLEIWDYLHLEMPGFSGVPGGVCFAIMFIVIPLLRYIDSDTE
ncbi:MAG: hypothetical protein NC115_08855 [Bacteroidales bacterium]|nr:hypothetical protein [Bacteroidales bacterium]